jgi:hypothetical protein
MNKSLQTKQEWPPAMFAVGYHQIHPDVSLNHQMNQMNRFIVVAWSAPAASVW